MLTFTIEAGSADSAHQSVRALADFDVILIETADGKHLLRVGIFGNDREALHLLDTLDAYLMPARWSRRAA